MGFAETQVYQEVEVDFSQHHLLDTNPVDRLYDNSFDYYDPDLFNHFGYVNDSPLMFNDPYGYSPTITVLVYNYLAAIVASPETQHDLQMLADDAARGDTVAIVADMIGVALPAMSSTATKATAKSIQKAATKYGDDAAKAITRHLDEVVKLFGKAGDEIIDVTGKAINSVDDLINFSGKLKRLTKGTRQGIVKGNIDEIFTKLTKNSKKLPSGAYKLSDGAIVNMHKSSKTGIMTIDINKLGKKYKIRVTK